MPSEAGAHGFGARALLRHAKEHGARKSYYFDEKFESYHEHDPSALNPFLEVLSAQDGRWLRLVELSLRTIIWRSMTDIELPGPTHDELRFYVQIRSASIPTSGGGKGPTPWWIRMLRDIWNGDKEEKKTKD
jgi:hypothetical protein